MSSKPQKKKDLPKKSPSSGTKTKGQRGRPRNSKKNEKVTPPVQPPPSPPKSATPSPIHELSPNKKETPLQQKVRTLIQQVEFYPDKLKRALTKKTFMKAKPNFKVVAATNKRKLSVPRRQDSSPSQKRQRSPSPALSMAAMVQLIEEKHVLSEEDFMEILHCASPVWWEDPPDPFYAEEPISQSVPSSLSATTSSNNPKDHEQTPIDKISSSQSSMDFEGAIEEFKKISTLKKSGKFVKKQQKLESILGNIKVVKNNPAIKKCNNKPTEDNNDTTVKKSNDKPTEENNDTTIKKSNDKLTEENNDTNIKKSNNKPENNDTNTKNDNKKPTDKNRHRNFSNSTDEDLSDLSFNEEEVLNNLESMEIPMQIEKVLKNLESMEIPMQQDTIQIKVEDLGEYTDPADVFQTSTPTVIIPDILPPLTRKPIRIENKTKSDNSDSNSDYFENISHSNFKFITDDDIGVDAYEHTIKVERESSPDVSVDNINVRTDSLTNDISEKKTLPKKVVKDQEYITVYKIMSNDDQNRDKTDTINNKKIENVQGNLNSFFKKCKNNNRFKKSESPAIPVTAVSDLKSKSSVTSSVVVDVNRIKCECQGQIKNRTDDITCICGKDSIFECRLCKFHTDRREVYRNHLSSCKVMVSTPFSQSYIMNQT